MVPSGENLSRGRKLASWLAVTTLAIAVLFIGLTAAQAQTYSEIYHFTSADGGPLTSTLLIDRGGKLYGTTEYGQYGTCGWAGMVYQLKPEGSGWVLNPLHCFTAPLGGDDGAFPIDYGGLTFGPDGNIYGTTDEGGINNGTDSLGTVFKLTIKSDSEHFVPDGKLRVYRSRTGGNEWEALTKGLPQNHCYVNVLRDAMAVDSLDQCGVYFGTSGGQVYASADAGDSWAPIVRDLPAVLSVEVQTLG